MGARTRSRSLQKKLERIYHDYVREHDCDVIDPDKLADWAIETGRYKRQPLTMQQMCKRDLARAMRNEMYEDPQKRDVRVMHPVRSEQGTFWGNIKTAQPEHMELSFSNRRLGVLWDCVQLKVDHDSYNDNNLYGAKLRELEFDFAPDLAELKKPTRYPSEKPESE